MEQTFLQNIDRFTFIAARQLVGCLGGCRSRGATFEQGHLQGIVGHPVQRESHILL